MLAYGLGVGLGVGCAYVPAIGAVQRWFVRRRGFASGLAVSGIGVGTLVMPPLASLPDRSAWDGAAPISCSAPSPLLSAGAWRCLIENDPRDRGPRPRRRSAASRASRRPAARALRLREAIRSRRFIALYAACLICSFGVFVPFVHLVPYARRSRRRALVRRAAARRDRRRQHRRALLPRRPRRPDGAPDFAAADVRRHGVRAGDLGWSRPASGRWPPSRFVYGVFYGGWVAVLPAVVMDYFGGRNVSGHHRHPLYQRRLRHPDRPERRRLRLRSQPQLHGCRSWPAWPPTSSPRSSWP